MRKNENVSLASFDDLFKTPEETNQNGEMVLQISLTELYPFKNHPFKVRDDEEMEEQGFFIISHD